MRFVPALISVRTSCGRLLPATLKSAVGVFVPIPNFPPLVSVAARPPGSPVAFADIVLKLIDLPPAATIFRPPLT